MLRIGQVIKPWNESGALSAHINLYGFWTEEVFLTKSGELGIVLKARRPILMQQKNAKHYGLLATQIVSNRVSSFDDALTWDCQLRTLLCDSADPGICKDAFALWEALWQTWIENLRKTGKVQEAQELERLVGEFKAKHQDIQTAKKFVSSAEFAQLMAGVSGPSR